MANELTTRVSSSPAQIRRQLRPGLRRLRPRAPPDALPRAIGRAAVAALPLLSTGARMHACGPFGDSDPRGARAAASDPGGYLDAPSDSFLDAGARFVFGLWPTTRGSPSLFG